MHQNHTHHTHHHQSLPVIDIHTHLCSVDTSRTGCYVSPRLARSLWMRYLMRRMGVSLKLPPEEIDARILAHLRRHLDDSPHVGRAVILALDELHDGGGRRLATDLYVSNDYVFELARKDARLLPGASVHPHRPDWRDELQRCAERGAVLVKWLPSTQGIDPAERRHLPYYRELVRAGLPLLSHAGFEYTLPTVRQRLSDPRRLRLALEEGVTVIAAHGGGVEVQNPFISFSTLADMLLYHPNFYADTSATTTPTRSFWLARYARRPELRARLVHGSDYPIPVIPWNMVGALPLKMLRRISKVQSEIERDYLLKLELGFDEAYFTRAARLLRLTLAARWIKVPIHQTLSD